MSEVPKPWNRIGRRADGIRAFTLVELLVVTAIVGILTSLLLPALAQSKARTRSVVCLGQLRQMAIAAQSYTQTHDDSYPIAYFTRIERGVTVVQAWDLTTLFEDPPRVVPGLLWEGHGTERVQQCPSFHGPANWLEDPVTGYNYNTSYLGRGQFESIPTPARAAWVKRPSETVLFGDGEYSGGANKFMRAPWPSPGDAGFRGRWTGTQGFRHAGRSNASFGDGHAASLRGRYTDNADGGDRVAPGTGFLSPDNSLYDWD